jgi:hypothetical protein
MRLRNLWPVLAVLATLLLTLTIPGHASPLQYEGNLELRSPVWASRHLNNGHDFEPRIQQLDLAGNVRFFSPGSRFAAWVSGEHSFSRGFFVHENKMRTGLDLRLGPGKNPGSLTLFSFWERRFDIDVDRVFVGVRVGFHGDMD